MNRLSLLFLSVTLFSGFSIVTENEDYDTLREVFYKNDDPRNLSPEEFKRKLNKCREDPGRKGCKQVFFCAAEKSGKFSTELRRNEDRRIEYSIQKRELTGQLARGLLSSKELIREDVRDFFGGHSRGIKKEFCESPKLFALVSTAAPSFLLISLGFVQRLHKIFCVQN